MGHIIQTKVYVIIIILLFLTGNLKIYAQWQQIPELEFTVIYCMLTTEDNSIYIGGNNGTLLRSTDDGSSWNNVMGGEFWVDTVVSLSEGLGYIFAGANGAGSIFRSPDNGETWFPANQGFSQSARVNGFAFVDNSLFAATSYGIYSSSDSGNSWNLDNAGLELEQNFPHEYGGLAGITESNYKLFTIKAQGGTVYSSDPDSIFWQVISSGKYTTGFAITSIDTNIFVATQEGIFLYKGDTTWIPRNNGLPVETNILYECMFAVFDSLLFAVFDRLNGPIYVTNNLGETWTEINDSVFAGTPVNSVTANDSYLFVGTGNGAWRISLSKVITSVDDNVSLNPEKFYLLQNYPNPFNPSTTIRFSVKEFSHVILKVYDILGREIATLVNEEKSPGEFEVTFNAGNLSSGTYFYKITAGNYSAVKKVILLK